MNLSTTPIQFAFDYLSPYAYLAWTQLPDLAARYGREVEPVPILLAGVLNTHGTKGPAEVPAERAYLFKDVSRSAHALGVPITVPASHPFNPLLALRLTCLPLEPELKQRLVTWLFNAVWAQGREISDPEVVADLCRSLGIEPEPALAQTQTDAIKTRLRENTERMLGLGVFGVPSMLVDGELYWGFESLPNLERRLRGEESLDPALLERWQKLKPSAVRAGKPG